jgi:hypothetical protein
MSPHRGAQRVGGGGEKAGADASPILARAVARDW